MSDQDNVIAGALAAEDGAIYPVCNGIPRFVLTRDEGQAQTSQTFGFKWKKRDTYDSPAAKRNAIGWYIEKYGFESIEAWAEYFASRKAVLDVGCGSGFSSSLWLDTAIWDGQAMWIGVDISEAIDVAQERLGHIANTHFVQADVLQLPFPDGSFDLLFSEGVLHHTPSTRAALLASSRVLAPGGEFHFYVYRRKAPVREFTDDYIREQIATLSDEAAWEAMRSLTHLGQVLAEAGVAVELHDDVPLLGIKAGRYDVQRLIYWHFAKLYWNPVLSFEENLHVNFDWYRPRYAHRQTAEEVRRWCAEARLAIKWFHEQESGFTVRAIKE
jgi:ubiquinone/menaquinone biosynthesis C-methylase UbiE